MSTPESATRGALEQRVAALDWYHTFDLGGIITPGLFDHRHVVERLPFPDSLAGARCLDVASSDGYFAFELARRGADEVVSLDLPDHAEQDFHTGARSGEAIAGSGRANQCFELVREVTGLEVQRVDGSVYDLDPAQVGRFDYVFIGNILIHLRDPVLALERVREVTSGRLLSFECVSLPLSVLRPFTPTGHFGRGDDNTWWMPSLKGHQSLIEAPGFRIVRAGGPILQPFGARLPRAPRDRASFPRSWSQLVWWTFTRQFGAPSGWVIAEVDRRTDSLPPA